MRRRIRLMAVLAGLALIATLAVGGTAARAKDPESFNGTIKIFRLAYFPNVVIVEPGVVIHFQNQDGKQGEPHSATAYDGSFDTGVFFDSRRSITTPATPGVYEYFCVIHPFMRGFLDVVAAPAEPPPPVVDDPGFTG